MLRVCFMHEPSWLPWQCKAPSRPDFRGLQHESVRHVHAQHSHHFRKAPFFQTKHMKRARKHRLGAGLIFSAGCVCKSQSRLVFHVTVCTWERHCVPIGCWHYRECVSALWLVESLRTSTLVSVTEWVSAIWLVKSLLPRATYFTFPGKSSLILQIMLTLYNKVH